MKRFKEILLIDDDPIANFLTETVLKRMDLTDNILVAMNGQEALEIILNSCNKGGECPELIFLDINMPVMNGFEFLNTFKEIEIRNRTMVRVILLSSSANPEDQDKAKNHNIQMILKPLTNTLVEKLLYQ